MYLALILDAYSRKGIGWALGRTLEATLTIEALKMALARRQPAAGLVHHSDRGVQYAARDYTDLLNSNGIVISKSRKGNPWDNAACESTDESQPAIPWRVGLHQSPPPLHRLSSAGCTLVLPVTRFAANGKQCLNWLCQPRGQAHRDAFGNLVY